MRLVFVHDHRFVRSTDGKVFTGGSFPSTIWARYLRHFDEIVVIGRDGGMTGPSCELARADTPMVRFELISGMEGALPLLRGNAALDRLLDRELDEADALIARVPSVLALGAAQKARARAIPYALEVVGCAWDSYFNHGSLAARAYASVAYWRQRRALRLAPIATYVTREFLQGRYPCPGFTTYVSDVEIEPMDDTGHRARLERLNELTNGRPPRFGTVGSLRVRYKGYHVAILALAKLRAEGLDVRYSILGAGDPAPYRAMAEKHGVADLVDFAGVRPAGRGVAEWLDGIDVHMQPSFQEGLPRATVEAMSRGVACIGSTAGGLPELLSPDRMHQPGDVNTLAKHIRAMAVDPARIAVTSSADMEAARDYFQPSLERRRDQTLSRLHQLAKARRAQ